MRGLFLGKHLLLIILSMIINRAFSQDQSIKDLEFLIGTWEVREDNEEKTWWEESTRTGRYALDSTYIELNCTAVSSGGKERTYLWLIHYNNKVKQFEMVSMFSNWHNVQFDILEWNAEERKLTIRNDPERTLGFHERLGVLTFEEDFNGYSWSGENKYGNPDEPSIWRYLEIGKRTE